MAFIGPCLLTVQFVSADTGLRKKITLVESAGPIPTGMMYWHRNGIRHLHSEGDHLGKANRGLDTERLVRTIVRAIIEDRNLR